MVEAPPARQLVFTKPAVVQFLRLFLSVFHGGVFATSWYRDPAHNRSVGSVSADSQHLLGLAIDVAGRRAELLDFARAARSVGLVAVDEGGHVHVQLFPAGWIRSHGYGWLFSIR
jgi:uncharacterized protein YcbK (DUF882 family)